MYTVAYLQNTNGVSPHCPFAVRGSASESHHMSVTSQLTMPKCAATVNRFECQSPLECLLCVVDTCGSYVVLACCPDCLTRVYRQLKLMQPQMSYMSSQWSSLHNSTLDDHKVSHHAATLPFDNMATKASVRLLSVVFITLLMHCAHDSKCARCITVCSSGSDQTSA